MLQDLIKQKEFLEAKNSPILTSIKKIRLNFILIKKHKIKLKDNFFYFFLFFKFIKLIKNFENKEQKNKMREKLFNDLF